LQTVLTSVGEDIRLDRSSVWGPPMNEVTRVLFAVEQGDPQVAEQLLPLVYDELRKLAAHRLAQEAPGQTLQATALVHEAYLRLVADEQRGSPPGWESRGHFFAAAAEAMRRILVDRAREKNCLKRGGGWRRVDLDHLGAVGDACEDDLLALDEVLGRLAQENKPCAELVKLRFFAGLNLKEAAAVLGLPRRTANRYWAYARAWLYEALSQGGEPRREKS
jgi:RNA polymerase sigma factor (TIGR02999 family)